MKIEILTSINKVLEPIKKRLDQARSARLEDWHNRSTMLQSDGLVRELARQANSPKFLPRERRGKIIFPLPEAEAQRNKIEASLVERCIAIMSEPNPGRIAPLPPFRKPRKT